MSNIHDIVKKTNLSLGTVSNYLNGKKIKEQNRHAIEEAIRELDYKVNTFGRNLKTNRSGVIGIMVPNLDDPFAPKVISAVEQYFREKDYAVMICDTMGREDIERQVMGFFLERRVEGVVLFPAENDCTRYNIFAENGICSVAIDMKIDNFLGDFVAVNNRNMGKIATQYLLERGQREIGILAGPEAVYSANERLFGYQDALNEAGLEIRPDYIKRSIFVEHKMACSLAEELMTCPKPPTAILATNYFLTMGAISAFNQLKCQIGKDISLFGFDNFTTMQIIVPNITLIEQPIPQIAAFAGNKLLERIKGEKDPPVERLIDGWILEGDSVVDFT